MTKIFVLTEHVNPYVNTTGYYWNRIIRELANNIGGISVICPKQKYISNVNNNNSVYYYFTWRQVFSEKKIVFRIFSQAIKAVEFSIQLLKKVNKKNVVICGTNPALLIFLMPIIKKISGFSWILVVHDVFPENLVPANIVSDKNILYTIVSAYSNWVYKCADRVVVIGRDMQSLINKKIYPSTCSELIPNLACPSEIEILPKVEALFIKELGWQKKIVFQFFGNMGRVQGINNILSAILSVTHPSAAFLFVGDGAMVPGIKSFMVENPNRSVAYFEPTPNQMRSRALAACDVAIVTLERGMLGLGVPSKSYFSLAADKPLLVVSDFGSEICKVVEEDNVGWWCKPDDPCALSSMIDHICSLDLKAYAGRPRTILVEKYSDDIALEKYCRLVRELLK